LHPQFSGSKTNPRPVAGSAANERQRFFDLLDCNPPYQAPKKAPLLSDEFWQKDKAENKNEKRPSQGSRRFLVEL